jgi:glycosyltransferase involved in cell wall biosynthesis
MERYAASLCASLRRAKTRHEFVELCPRLPPVLETRLRPGVKRFLREQYYIGAAAARAHVDLMFFPAFPPGPFLAHPFAMVVYDAVSWQYRDTMGLLGRCYLAPSVRHAARRARTVLTISRSVKSELAALLGRPEGEIVYVGAGVDAPPAPCAPARRDEALSRLGLARPFLLAVGSIEPRKNYPALFRAMQLVFDRSEAQLAVAGRWAWGSEEVRRLVAVAGNRIRILGYVSDADLAVLYDAAEGCLQPSIYEGLGLPVLEALSHGLPVVANDIAVFREIGPDRVHLVDFRDPVGVSQRILWLLDNPAERARIKAAAFSLTRELTWDAAAARCIAAFDRLESQGAVGSAAA